MLQQFHSVKHLSLSTETIQVLNLFVELISHQPSPLVNLESLRILSKILCVEKHVRTRVIMSTEVKNYLLSGSPKATLTEVLV
ncbi:hypothetical protein QVD17_40521 [Tagetes erecta]|uniref:Uncharacterized protein n=1 Tax=Tagetes erecta TaxID=13708 RepID=A0AAD8NHX5_TARER|nr:hypothetical protein QVD17_40521 [Tagetes erecta]